MLSEIRRMTTNRAPTFNWFRILLATAVLFPMVGCQTDNNKASGNGDGSAAGDETRKTETPTEVLGRIEGDSMAPYLKGSCFQATCERCNHSFEFGFTNDNRPQTLTCPLCGKRNSTGDRSTSIPATEVRIEKTHPGLSIQRWDVVAFENDQHVSVKRVLGLPLETIEFREGDLYVNGQIYAKPPRIQMQTRQLLFDSAFVRDQQLTILPKSETDKVRFPLPLNRKWKIRYHQFANYATMLDNQNPEPIKDFYGYNQSTSRNLNPCDDFGCQFLVDSIPSGKGDRLDLTVTLNSQRFGRIQFRFLIQDRFLLPTIEQNGARVFWSKYQWPEDQREFRVYVSVIDGRARFLDPKMTDRSTILERPNYLAPQDPTDQITLENNLNNNARLTQFQVYRDIYYYSDPAARTWKTGRDEYFVVGDNVPRSIDSRNTGKLPAKKEILGRVVDPPTGSGFQ